LGFETAKARRAAPYLLKFVSAADLVTVKEKNEKKK